MDNQMDANEPNSYQAIWQETTAQGFGMPSDQLTGSLLRALAASKPGGTLLELGTGTGAATCWLLDGMDAKATLVTVDNDELPLSVARKHLGSDPRIKIHSDEGENILNRLPAASIDLLFADSWPGKYYHLEEALALLKKGGIYFVDDMLPQPNWPAGHGDKATALVARLDSDPGLKITKLNWSTGIIIAVKK